MQSRHLFLIYFSEEKIATILLRLLKLERYATATKGITVCALPEESFITDAVPSTCRSMSCAARENAFEVTMLC